MKSYRKKNSELRPREHLYESEVDKIIEACKELGYSIERNKTLILTTYRHALRASEAVSIKWDDICFINRTIQIRRTKGSLSGEHYISDKEIRYLKALKKKCPKQNPYVFYSREGGHLTVSSFQKLFERLGIICKFPFKIHPHMLRHGWGYKAINSNIDLRHMQLQMGHVNIANTAMYAKVQNLRFDGLFKD